MMTLPLPAAPAGTVQEQAAQQYSYLVQMAQQLFQVLSLHTWADTYIFSEVALPSLAFLPLPTPYGSSQSCGSFSALPSVL